MSQQPKAGAGPTYGRAMGTIASELRTRPSVDHGVTRSNFGPTVISGPGVYEYQPGNGTRYVMVLSRMPDGSGWITGCPDATVLAYVQNYGRVVPLPPGEPVTPDVVRRHLGCSVPDSVVLAEALGHLARLPHVTCEEYLASKAGVPGCQACVAAASGSWCDVCEHEMEEDRARLLDDHIGPGVDDY